MIYPVPKPTPRVLEKQRKRQAEAKAIRACYRAVDRRDKGRCRVCRRIVSPDAPSMLARAERHHLHYRSRGGEHTTDNVVTLCRVCHDEIHVTGRLRLSGDADERNEMGQLAGVTVERLTEQGWRVEKLV